MAKYQKKTDYQAKYPGVSEKIIEVLEKSDRQMEYLQYDIKVERCRIDSASGTVTYLPSREDSYERLLEENKQFAAAGESVDDVAIKTVMIEKMLTCLKHLSPEEQKLITALFFASTFWTKLQNIFGHCCMSKLDKVAKLWLVVFGPAI